jgi:hypothetical protein
MGEIADALAIALDAIEEHAEEITDPLLTARIAYVRAAMERLQLDLDNASGA